MGVSLLGVALKVNEKYINKKKSVIITVSLLERRWHRNDLNYTKNVFKKRRKRWRRHGIIKWWGCPQEIDERDENL